MNDKYHKVEPGDLLSLDPPSFSIVYYFVLATKDCAATAGMHSDGHIWINEKRPWRPDSGVWIKHE